VNYTRAADQKRLAASAMRLLGGQIANRIAALSDADAESAANPDAKRLKSQG
jgi:hypothetical protein